MNRRPTRDALALIARDVGHDAAFRRRVEQETFNAQVAALTYRARTAARITQSALAELVGTSQSVIARLEDADYEGHSLPMLRRIADALNRSVEVWFTKRRSTRARTRRGAAVRGRRSARARRA